MSFRLEDLSILSLPTYLILKNILNGYRQGVVYLRQAYSNLKSNKNKNAHVEVSELGIVFLTSAEP